jgi:hypothetical protein
VRWGLAYGSTPATPYQSHNEQQYEQQRMSRQPSRHFFTRQRQRRQVMWQAIENVNTVGLGHRFCGYTPGQGKRRDDSNEGNEPTRE